MQPEPRHAIEAKHNLRTMEWAMRGWWLGVIVVVWVGSYVAYRSISQEVWSADGRTYVILPSGAGAGLYYLWRPLMLADAKLTGMNFHIGPHPSP